MEMRERAANGSIDWDKRDKESENAESKEEQDEVVKVSRSLLRLAGIYGSLS
jgi:hypothetical protein